MPSSVQLYRYDLTNGMARQFSLGMTGTQIDAIWHTAIVVYGVEFYFDGGVGISEAVPGTTRFGVPAMRDDLGTTQKSLGDFRAFNAGLQMSTFGPNHYDLLRRNCNHYTEEAATFLTGSGIPADVAQMIPNLLATPLGQMMRPNLEMMSQNPNVNAPQPRAAPMMGGGGFGGQGGFGAGAQPQGGSGRSTGSQGNQSGVSYSQVSEAALSEDTLETLQAQIVVMDCYEDDKAKKIAFETLERILRNLIANPREPKFRRLSRSGATYTTKLAVVDGAEDFLLGVGFVVEGSEVVLKVANIPLLVTAATLLSDTANGGEADAVPAPAPAPKGPFAWSPLDAVSSLPCGALVAGYEGDQSLYCGRSKEGNPRFGGKLAVHLGGLNVCKDGKEVGLKAGESEVLCVTEPNSVVWVPAAIFRRAVKIQAAQGAVQIQEALIPIDAAANMYVGRGKEGGDFHPGVATLKGTSGLNEPTVHIPYGGVATEVTDCDLLCLVAKLPKSVVSQVDSSTDGAMALKQWKARTSKPFHSLDTFLKAEPVAKRVIKRRPKLQPRVQAEEGIHYPEMVLCHDHEGGYARADQCSISVGPDEKLSEKTYTVRHWEEVKMFIYFSHAMVSIPTEEWVRNGHNHGSLVLGTFIIEPAQGGNFHSLLQSAQKVRDLVAQMRRFQAANSFDGWLLNIEVGVPPSLIENLLLFVRLLTQASHEVHVDSQVLWYDAVTLLGHLQYQNGLTQKNLPFMQACDGIFTNYWWNPLMAHFSAFTAGGVESGKTKQVYMGIDVYGRRTFGGGGFNCHTALLEIQKANLSCAVFAPAWTAARAKTKSEYVEGEEKMWGPMKPYMRNHGQGPCITAEALPFSTNFCSGFGAKFHTPRETASNAWAQISLQQPAPQLVGTGIEWNSECGLYSDRSLLIGSKGAEAFPLFAVDLAAPKDSPLLLQLDVVLLKAPPVLEEEDCNAILLCVGQGDEGKKETHLRFGRSSPEKGTIRFSVELPAGRRATQILLAARQVLNVGGVTLSEVSELPPPAQSKNSPPRTAAAAAAHADPMPNMTRSPSSPTTGGMTRSYSSTSNVATPTKPIKVQVQSKAVGNQTLLQFSIDSSDWEESHVQQVAVMARTTKGVPVFCGVGYEPQWCSVVDGCTDGSTLGDSFTFYVTYAGYGPLSPMQVQSQVA